MANKYGTEYTKEWINDPAEQADKGTRNAHIKAFYETFPTVANTDVLYICKLQHRAYFLGLESLDGALGSGDVKVIDKDGDETTIVPGDLVDGQVEGGLDLVLIADGTTAASLKLLAKFLMD